MSKEFFKLYLKSRDAVFDSDSLNMKCIRVFEKYLFSYKWCRNDTEKQIFENLIRGITPNKMVVQTNKKGVIHTLKPESVRSASSRLSKRFYKMFGDDFNSVLTSDATVPENQRKLNIIIAKCISMNDDFIFQNHYSSVLQSGIEAICQRHKDVSVPDKLEFSKDILDALTFFKIYDNKSLFSMLKELDEESVVLIYKVLTTPEYFMQRAEIIEKLASTDYKGKKGVESRVYLHELNSLKLDIKNKDNILDDKDTEIERLKAKLRKSNKKVSDLTTEYNDLGSEYQRLKQVAKNDHAKLLSRIKELESSNK